MSNVSPLLKPLVRPLTRAITEAGVGLTVDERILLMFASGEKGSYYDPYDLGTFFSDTARTTPGVPNALVASGFDKSPNALHWTMATEASRPTLRGTPTGGDLFDGFGTPGAGWIDDGDGLASATASAAALPTTNAAVVGRHYLVVYAVTRSAGSVTPSFGGRTGTARSTAGTFVDFFDNATNTNALTFTGSTFTGTVRVVAVHDISADAVTGPYWLQVSGSQSFATAAQDMSGIDKVSTCIGAMKFSDSARGIVMEFGNASVGGFLLDNAAAAGVNWRWLAVPAAGANPAYATTSAEYNAPATSAITGTIDRSQASAATEMGLRIDGYAAGSVADPSGVLSGNFANVATFYGRRNNATVPLTGMIAPFVTLGRLFTDSERAMLESTNPAAQTVNVLSQSFAQDFQSDELEEFSAFATSDTTDVYDLYDSLVTAYPAYIMKSVLGQDGDGNDVCRYDFRPTPATSGIGSARRFKLILLSGVHGGEKAGVYCLYQAMKAVCEATEGSLKNLRDSAHLIVVPIVTPYAYDLDQRKNENGVDISRNFPTGWTLVDPSSENYGGASALSELSAQYVNTIFTNNRDAVYAGSFHNAFSLPDDKDFIWNASGSLRGQDWGTALIGTMSSIWQARYGWAVPNMGYVTAAPGGSEGMHAIFGHGIEGGTFEIAVSVPLAPDDSAYSEFVARMGTETIANWLLLAYERGVRNKYGRLVP